MGSYREDDYYPILMRSIRGGIAVPFDCYLLIKNAHRIVHYLNRNDVFPQEKLDKLGSFSVNQLHIKRDDYPAYLAYLQCFFQTEEGKVTLAQLREEGKTGSIEGLPDDFEVDGSKIVVAATPAPEEKLTKDSGLNELIKVLKSTVETMDDQFRLRREVSEKDATNLMLSTDRILLHLVRLKAGAASVGQDKTIISGTITQIQKEIVRIRGIAQTVPEEQRKVIRGLADVLQTDIELLAGIPKDPEFATHPKEVVKNITDTVRDDVWRLKRLLDAHEHELIEDSVCDVVDQIEQVIGTELKLKGSRKTPETAKAGDGAVVDGAADPKVAAGSARAEGDTASATTGAQRDKGIESAESAKGPESAKRAESAESAKSAPGAESATSATSNTSATGDESVERAAFDALKSENAVLEAQLNNAKSLVESGERKITELVSLKEANNNYIDSLEKESAKNKARIVSLLDQVSKLEASVANHEEGKAEFERIIQQQKADIESKDQRLLEKESEISQFQADLRKFRNIFGDASRDPEGVKAELEKLPYSREFLALLEQKEAIVNKHLADLERRNTESRELKREAVKLRGHLQGVSALKKELAARMDRMAIERETAIKSQDALHRKITILENLADIERKAVSRLTGMVDQLRRERMEHIDKTNAALRAHKEMSVKASALSNHVEGEVQKNKALLDQLESSRIKQKELSAEIGSLQGQLRALENENKRLSKQARDHAEGTGKTSEVYLASLEKKVESLRAESQELKAQQAAEQQRYITLERDFKALQLKIRKTEAA